MLSEISVMVEESSSTAVAWRVVPSARSCEPSAICLEPAITSFAEEFMLRITELRVSFMLRNESFISLKFPMYSIAGCAAKFPVPIFDRTFEISST